MRRYALGAQKIVWVPHIWFATYDLWLKAESWSLNFKILKKIIQ